MLDNKKNKLDQQNLNDTSRRLYLNNWAILSSEDEVIWHFGDINEELESDEEKV